MLCNATNSRTGFFHIVSNRSDTVDTSIGRILVSINIHVGKLKISNVFPAGFFTSIDVVHEDPPFDSHCPMISMHSTLRSATRQHVCQGCRNIPNAPPNRQMMMMMMMMMMMIVMTTTCQYHYSPCFNVR
ncbi:hypothetical protein I7I50_03784 [Histoplasma capsulatum G186AR]|uniref:Uncharacterized protein n=1 Tax=Ajellomyces capsulatus TaxID=5037 RepID=A0A8H7YPV4_AJECA|nr:hypothetical protein I7I52_04691 [Histoplasma capsulatum]QSS74849.1 hypothetical protein I7I50_03784 [Histoplasma capsulatum G186AR]